MFDMLLESGQRPSLVPSWGKGVALTLHVMIVAVLWRAPASPASGSPERGVVLPPLEPATSDHTTPLTVPIVGEQRLPLPFPAPPIVIPEGFVEPLGTPVIDIGSAAHPLAGPTLEPGDGVYLPSVVQDAPELLSAPTPVYPPLLRAAGVQGRVMVAAVVDTLGQAESGSVRIVLSDNPGFDAAALATVRAARFRPARIYGRAVRVLVQVPVVFRLN